MNNTEWTEIVAWIEARYPKAWKAEQVIAFYEDLEQFDASDVWTGVYGFYSEGSAFPPTGAQLASRARESRRDAAVEDRYDRPALPEPVTMPVDSWLTKWYPGETVTWGEHIRRVHKTRRCESRFCDIHSQEKENA